MQTNAIEQLPNDVGSLKEMISGLYNKFNDLTKENKDLTNELNQKNNEILLLEENVKLLKSKLFGRSSEKSKEDNSQPGLFNEAELGVDESELEGEIKSIPVKVHTRKSTKKGRKAIADHLPRNQIIIDLPENEKKCDCCKKDLPCIGKEITEEADIKPAEVFVNQYIKMKYGSCDCEESRLKEAPEIKTAKMPERMLPGSIASPGLLAFVFTGKFADALPFYRQEKIFKRHGLDIPRATMCNWTINAGKRCEPLLDLMLEESKNGPLINMDETTLQVIKETGRSPTGDSYMWVTIGYSSFKPIILYHYRPSRSGDVPLELLKDYEGYLQTDGYIGYDPVGELPYIIHVGCFVHSRRKFDEALKASKNKGSARVGIAFIKKIYKIEKGLRKQLDADEISRDKFVELRKEAVTPFLDKFEKWLKKKTLEVPEESLIGKAVSYTLNQWEKMIKYTDVWFLTPDNNRVENAIRPFVIGRKNWLFSFSSRGAEGSAAIYSLIETAKANDLEPYHYLKYLFNKLPQAKTKDDLKKLLPTNLTIEQVKNI